MKKWKTRGILNMFALAGLAATTTRAKSASNRNKRHIIWTKLY
jgi:hypothetical protein